jgi:hypothetical protein
MYAYCGNDPINYVDPEGLFFGFIIAAVAAAVGVVVSAVKKAKEEIERARGIGLRAPGVRTPPTFGGSLPGMGAGSGGGFGGFRTPPFVGGFLASTSAAVEDIGFVLSIDTWAWSGVGAVSLFLRTKGCDGELLALGQDKIADDDIGDYKCTFFNSCKEMGEKIRDLTKGVRIRRNDLDPKTPR